MKQLNCHIRGLTPLLHHSDRGADPLDPLKKEQAKITAKRKKAEADHEEIARLDWYLSIYTDKDNKPCMPTWNIFANLRDGARLTKRGKDVERAIIIDHDTVPMIYEGPTDLEALYADKRFVNRMAVGNQRNRVMRTRPIFPDWELKYSLEYDESVFNKDDVVTVIENAGKYVGLGDYRPRFGRYEIVKIH